MNFCSLCLPGRMCSPCADNWARLHAGNAKAIGVEWADRVVRLLRARGEALQDWPAYDDSNRVRATADRKMRHLAGADPVVREALARACAEAARERYEAVRSG